VARIHSGAAAGQRFAVARVGPPAVAVRLRRLERQTARLDPLAPLVELARPAPLHASYEGDLRLGHHDLAGLSPDELADEAVRVALLVAVVGKQDPDRGWLRERAGRVAAERRRRTRGA
jgi:hypothetical protein